MTTQTAQKHPYHLVNPSPWPLVGAISAGILATGAIRFMKFQELPLMLVGLGCVVFTLMMWWRDVIKESVEEKAHTSVVKIGLRYGMALFIASEVMFFFGFFWAYFNASLYPSEAIGSVWPPKGIEPFDAYDLPLFNTFLLLLSGCTVTWAHHAILENNRKDMLLGLAATIGLGMFFTFVQAVEYSHAPFALKDGIYPSTFFMATGFHGFHVIVGTLFLIVCFFRGLSGHFTPQSHFGFEAAAWYWHFVDVVWLFLFVSIYIGSTL